MTSKIWAFTKIIASPPYPRSLSHKNGTNKIRETNKITFLLTRRWATTLLPIRISLTNDWGIEWTWHHTKNSIDGKSWNLQYNTRVTAMKVFNYLSTNYIWQSWTICYPINNIIDGSQWLRSSLLKTQQLFIKKLQKNACVCFTAKTDPTK